MNNHDIDLPDLPPCFEVLTDRTHTEIRAYALAAIEADRKKRWGEPALVGWTVSTNGGGILHASKYAEHEAKRLGYSLPVYRLTASQPADPIVSDVEAIVRLLERREWAEHVATTPLGQRLETAVTALVGAGQQPAEPDQKPSVEALAEMANGRSFDRKEPASKVLERRPPLKHQGYQPIQSGPLPLPPPVPQPSEPVKSSLKVSYDAHGDCLYVVCDSNEPADAEEDDMGILYRRAISDGRLVGVTIMNFMGPHAKSSDDTPQPAEPVAYHPCTPILIEGLKRLPGGSAILAEWDKARSKLDAPQPAESLKSRRIEDVLRGLQASVAVGSDGAWVSIRREARDAAVKLLQELNPA